MIFKALNQAALKVEDGDVLVAQKVISKAEGRLVKLKDVTPSEEANTLASETDKDPRLVQAYTRGIHPSRAEKARSYDSASQIGTRWG